MEENKKALNNESSVPTDIITHSIQGNGFVKLHRQLLTWEWYSDIPVRILFLHCLLKANFKTTKWKGQIIKTGEFITSIASLSNETGLSQRQTRTALSKLKSTGELTSKTTSHYSIISINNWDKWQVERQTERHTSDKLATTDKERKECKECKEDNKEINNIGKNKDFQIPTIEEITEYCLERNNSINSNQFYDYYASKGWMIGKNKMKDWKAAIRTWENNQKSNSNKTEEEILDGWSL